MSYLEAAENFLGTELSDTSTLERLFKKLSHEEHENLRIALQEFEASWVQSIEECQDTMHFGRAFDTFYCPQSFWHPEHRDTIGRILDPSRIALQLVYSKKISVWVPSFTESTLYPKFSSNIEFSEIHRFLSKLVDLRPFVLDGSVTIVPDKYYAELVGWDNGKPIAKLAQKEAKNELFRNILGAVDFITDDLDTYCSDGKVIHVYKNAESIIYIEPLNSLNEDILVQSTLSNHLACARREMFEIMKLKYSTESVASRESTWQTASIFLPKIHGLGVNDLYLVRKNEDAFELLRTSVSDFIRRWEQANQLGALSERDAIMIFDEATAPIRMSLESKVKSKSLKANLESAGVSFTTGAIASSFFSASPLAALATGATSSSLKLIYDMLTSRNAKVEKSLLRLYSLFSGVS